MCLPPSLHILNALWSVILSSFFLSLSPSSCTLFSLNLCCGAKVLVENSKELVIILNNGGCSWLPEKLTIFFPAHQTWSLSLSLFLKNTFVQKKQRDFPRLFKDGSINEFSNWNCGKYKHITSHWSRSSFYLSPSVFDTRSATKSDKTILPVHNHIIFLLFLKFTSSFGIITLIFPWWYW